MNTLPIPLTELAEQIRLELRAGVEHAARAGALLIDAKDHVQHGQWLPWLQDNLGLSERSAQNYMRLSRALAALPPSKAQRVADLPLREAIESLAEPKPEPIHIVPKWLPKNSALAMVSFNESDESLMVQQAADHPGFFYAVALVGGEICFTIKAMRAEFVEGLILDWLPRRLCRSGTVSDLSWKFFDNASPQAVQGLREPHLPDSHKHLRRQAMGDRMRGAS